ncbi:ribosome recycling factor [Candidatus Absconditicoccus praedator]|nr:ribosome recycling factor [Candidatus Absconditicoccus praedator]
MNKSIKHLENELASLQLGRASTSLVDGIDVFVSSWGMTQKINQLGNTTILDAQSIKIQPWDKSIVSDIEKAIYNSGLGLTPINQGDGIIINIPPLTQERRKELVKYVNKLGENTKISLRNIRHDTLKDIKTQYQQEEISENEKNLKEEEIDKTMKEFNQKVDEITKNKSDEIMKI